MTSSEPRFAITFRPEWLPHDEDEPCKLARLGTISLGRHRETFVATIGFWREEDYAASWRSAALQLSSAHIARATLITSVAGDAARPFLNWWPMYRVGELVFVQEQWLTERPAGWTWSDPWAHVPAHERRNEDGDRLSEWTVPVELVLRGLTGEARRDRA